MWRLHDESLDDGPPDESPPDHRLSDDDIAGRSGSGGDDQNVGPSHGELDLVARGAPVTITGAGCTPGHWGWATIDLSHSSAVPAIFAPGDFGLYDDEFFIASDGDLAGGTVGASGRWSMTARVPMVAPGPARIVASCTPLQGDDATLTDFSYRPISVKVTSPYGLAVRPGLTVAPGAEVSISPIGGGCGAADYVYVALYATAPKVTQVVQGVGTVTSGTSWDDTSTVPRGLAPGLYRLEADCAYSRGAVLGSYPAVSLNVT
jgi:hypothetical protein